MKVPTQFIFEDLELELSVTIDPQEETRKWT